MMFTNWKYKIDHQAALICLCTPNFVQFRFLACEHYFLPFLKYIKRLWVFFFWLSVIKQWHIFSYVNNRYKYIYVYAWIYIGMNSPIWYADSYFSLKDSLMRNMIFCGLFLKLHMRYWLEILRLHLTLFISCNWIFQVVTKHIHT